MILTKLRDRELRMQMIRRREGVLHARLDPCVDAQRNVDPSELGKERTEGGATDRRLRRFRDPLCAVNGSEHRNGPVALSKAQNGPIHASITLRSAKRCLRPLTQRKHV